jgi:hypothetical protein
MNVKNVTKSEYTRLLSIIGCSERPLSKYEIQEVYAKEKKKTKQRQVYRMIRTLAAEDPDVPRHLRFLNIKLKETCMKRISELEKRDGADYHHLLDFILGDRQTTFFPDQNVQATSEVEKMCWQGGNSRYLLNFRGFLLFLNGESKSTVHGSKDRIRKVMLNPYTTDFVPFLMYWQDFEEMEFDVIRILMDLVNDLGEDNILDPSIDANYLLLRITERYYSKVSKHFDILEECIFLDPRSREQLKKYSELQIGKKIREYRLTMLKMLKKLLSEQVAIVDRIYEMYSRY